MTTKYKLAEQALRIFYPALTSDAKTHIQEMMLAVSQARDKYIRTLYFQKLSVGEHDIPFEYVSVYEGVPLQYDTVLKRHYANLPTRVVDLKDERGVYQVATESYPEDALIPLKQTFVSMYKGLEAYGLEDYVGYYPQRDRVYIVGKIGEKEKLRMLLVSAGDDIDPLDNFPIASDAEDDIIKAAVQLYSTQKQIPQDKVNNNNSDA